MRERDQKGLALSHLLNLDAGSGIQTSCQPSPWTRYEDPEDSEPGPGTYALPPAIGTQPSSPDRAARPSAPGMETMDHLVANKDVALGSLGMHEY